MSCSFACQCNARAAESQNFLRSNEARKTYPLVQLGHLDRDRFGLLMPLQLVEPRFLLHDLAQHEREQLFVVACLGEVFAEAL